MFLIIYEFRRFPINIQKRTAPSVEFDFSGGPVKISLNVTTGGELTLFLLDSFV